MIADSPIPPHILDGEALREELIEIGKNSDLTDFGKQSAVLTLFKQALARGRDFARQELEAGSSGIETAKLLCLVQDIIIQALYDYTTSFPYRASTDVKGEKLSILAVGGYGRGLMAPGSDVDILFILPYKQTPWGESVVEYMLYILWDLGLKVGHATRTVEDCLKRARDDMVIRTTILEARHLWGDQALYDELVTRFNKEVVNPSSTKDFITAKLEERDLRHTRAGESRYLVEPNIKDGKGGLRDLHTLYWIGKFVYHVDQPSQLIDKGMFTKSEYRRFKRAESFLWDVRGHLHFLTGRAQERLSFDLQPEMAKRLGFKAKGGQAGVERFMTRYFRIAKEVGDLTGVFCAALELREQTSAPRLGTFLSRRNRRKRKPTSVANFVVERGRLMAKDKKVFKSDPVNILRLFRVAEEERVYIHPDTLTLLSRSLGLIDDTLRNDEEANRIFLEILTSRQDLESVLRRMNESGVLGRFIPDFGLVEAMMQFNMYHHYTVDEHIIRAMGILSRIENGELADDHPLSHEIIHQVLSREVLYIALFLHDIAKGREGDHSIVGARIATELGPRLGLSSADTETVAWLVEHHLTMSDFAQTRDITDPKTITDFVGIVQSPERLRLLLILTVADIRAVGPGVWNGWKGELLRRLYDEAERVLSGGHAGQTATHHVASAKQDLAQRLSDWTDEEIDAFISRHEDPYWLDLDADTHERHAYLLQKADQENQPRTGATMHAAPDQFRDVTQISIYTADQRGLFAKLAGALTASGASIADARVFTTKDGMALDVFWVQASKGGPLEDRARLQRLKDMIADTLENRLDPAQVMPQRLSQSRQKAFSVEPQVLIDNGASAVCTVIEINAFDRPGLLYDIARTLAALEFSVASAHIATYGERAVGVYYIKDLYGLKVTHETKLRETREQLVTAVGNASTAEKSSPAA